MVKIDMDITLPMLWGEKRFEKSDWGYINIVVGPNGTGKSLFSEKIKDNLIKNEYTVRSLNAERMFGLEKQEYSYFGTVRNFSKGLDISEFNTLKSQGAQFGLAKDAFIILRERLDVRIKIEAILSDIFQKNIRLVEEGGFLKPKIQDLNSGNGEYSLQENECHGLKELITLLTFLYSETYNCLIFDEPELHLHPQFQSFFFNEVRKIAGNPKLDSTKKLFFIVTHSPYFVDVKTIEDLQNILVCHYGKPPTYLKDLEGDDATRLKKFVPRMNTHHKQFFFSPNPVFVEGYTDQQFFSIILEKLNKNVSAAGSCIIDVGGKDELEVFFRICKMLELNPSFIADLDTVFKGKLRRTVSNDERAVAYLQEKGIGVSVSQEIGELESKLKLIADDLVLKTPNDENIMMVIEQVKSFSGEELHKLRCYMLLTIMKEKERILGTVSPNMVDSVNFICGRYKVLLDMFESCNVYILEKGVVENYYSHKLVTYPNVGSKDKLFESERDFLLSCKDESVIKEKYVELVELFLKAIPDKSVDIIKHLKFVIIKWIQNVQWAIAKGDITNIDNLKSNAIVQYELYSQIMDIIELALQADKKFQCKIKLKKIIDVGEKEIVFCERTLAQEFSI